MSQAPSNRSTASEIRNENFWDMIRLNFCPTLKLVSFTALIVCLNTTIFLFTTSRGIAKGGTFLQNRMEVLDDFGSNNPEKIHQGQYFRLFTACFLHLDFLHLLFNSFSTLFLVSSIERSFGWISTMLIYFLSGIVGNFF